MQRICWFAQSTSKLAVFFLCLQVLLWSTTARCEALHKQRIVSQIASLEGAAISPDGSKVALVASAFDDRHRGISIPSHLEVHDVSSLRVDASLVMPIFPSYLEGGESSGLESISRVRYCDRGTYILVYGGRGIFYVVDAISYGKVRTITLDLPAVYEYIDASCAAESNIVVAEVVTMRYSAGANRSFMMDGHGAPIKVFSIDTGKQIGEISQGISHDSRSTEFWGNLEVSPSGSHAQIDITYVDNGETKGQKIAVLDIGSSTVSTSIDAGFTIGQAAFVGESSIAVAGTGFTGADARAIIKIYDAQTGALERQIGDSRDAPHEVVEASADGRFLLAYTGKENHCEGCGRYSRGNLIITRAQFTVWDLTSGKIIAKSQVPASTENGRIAMFWGDPDGRHSSRPHFQISQSGNAVLVTGTRDENAVDVYLLK